MKLQKLFYQFTIALLALNQEEQEGPYKHVDLWYVPNEWLPVRRTDCHSVFSLYPIRHIMPTAPPKGFSSSHSATGMGMVAAAAAAATHAIDPEQRTAAGGNLRVGVPVRVHLALLNRSPPGSRDLTKQGKGSVTAGSCIWEAG